MAIEFNGSNQIDIGSFSQPSKTTICFWVKLTNTTPDPQRFVGGGDLWEVRLAGGTPNNDLYQGYSHSSLTSLSQDIWYHLVFTGDNSSGTSEMYIDGALDFSGGGNTGTTTYSTLSIGTRYGSSERTYGLMDDVRIYNRVLTASEISTIYACRGVDGINYGLLHRYIFNEAPPGTVASGANSIKDLMGNLNGTPISSPVYRVSELNFKRRVL